MPTDTDFLAAADDVTKAAPVSLPSDDDFLKAANETTTDALARNVTSPQDLPSAEHYAESHNAFLSNLFRPRPAAPTSLTHGGPPVDIRGVDLTQNKLNPNQSPNQRFGEAVEKGLNTPLLPDLPERQGAPSVPGEIGRKLYDVGRGLVTPGNVAITLGTAGLGGAFPAIKPLLGRGLGAYFGIGLLQQTAKDVPEVADAIKAKDWPRAAGAITDAVATGVLGTLAMRHAALGDRAKAASVSRETPVPTTSTEGLDSVVNGLEHIAGQGENSPGQGEKSPAAAETIQPKAETAAPVPETMPTDEEFFRAANETASEHEPAGEMPSDEEFLKAANEAAQPSEAVGQPEKSTALSTPEENVPVPENVSRETPEDSRETPKLGEPGSVGQYPVSAIDVDPVTFQFKANVGKGGAGEELRQVETYDPEKAGIISVWRNPANGRVYVVNGHHRVELAQRTGVKEMTVRFLHADNAAEARLKGALINIAEGRGDAMDAAKVFRDSGMTPERLKREGISSIGEKASQGMALAKLDPFLFEKVRTGDLPVERAAIIGRGVENPADQRALYDLVQGSEKGGKRLTNDQIGEMIRLANAETSKVTESQESLFGTEEATRSLIKEKAEVSDYVRRRLAQEKKLFAAVGNEKAAERLGGAGNVIKAGENAAVAEQTAQAQALYDKLSTSAGDVSDTLNRAAEELANGKNGTAAKERAYAEIRDALVKQADALAGRARGVSSERSKGNGRGGADQARAGVRDRPEAVQVEAHKPEIPKVKGQLAFIEGASNFTHGKLAESERIKLTPEDAKHADALVLNSSGFEFLLRAAGVPQDTAVRHSAAIHLSVSELPTLRVQYGRMMRSTFSGDGAQTPLDLERVHSVIALAERAGKSLIVLHGNPAFEGIQERALSEELAHAAQSRIKDRPSTSQHLGEGLSSFLGNEIAKKARARLSRYEGHADDNTMAVEIGVRLMYPEAYKELGLNPQEARNLAAVYIRSLRKEYGSAKPREIAARVFEHAPESSRQGERAAGASGDGQQGREGTPGRARSDVSGDEGERGANGNEPGGTEQGDSRAADTGRTLSPEAIRAAAEEDQRPLFGGAEDNAKANERDAAKLTKERLEAQLKAPITRDEQLKKLKRSAKQEQNNLFGDAAPESPQGMLFYRPKVGVKEAIDEMRALKQKRDQALEALEKAKTTPGQKFEGQKVLEAYTGERDLWGARVNQAVEGLRKLVPNPVEQEGLALMRENTPAELREWLNGSHPLMGQVADPATAARNIERLRPAIEAALNPTPEMQKASDTLTTIARATLKEGQRLGILESRWTPEQYVPHILHPKGEGDIPKPIGDRVGSLMGGKIGKYFAFAEHREFPTIMEAVANNYKPKTLNALDAFTVHGDKFATARATSILVNQIHDSGAGIVESDKAQWPKGWVELAAHSPEFRHVTINQTQAPLAGIGQPQNTRIASGALVVPKFIDEALRPVTDPDFMGFLPYFRKARVFQAYTKSIQLGLSLFHATTENYMALANMGPRGWLKGIQADRSDPQFLAGERDFIAHGGTSPVQGHTVEAYKSFNPGSIPTWSDIWQKAPGIRQMDAAAKSLTEFTFNKLQRQFKVTDYAMHSAQWLAKHPNATEGEIAAAKGSIAKEINAVYGGLHWENLGVSKATTELARAVLLAPDWTFSNIFNVKYAAERGTGPGNFAQRLWHTTEAGKLARAFWGRQLVGGIVATQLLSVAFSGKGSKNLTQVYMGKDREGKDIYQNVFFKGVSGDVINLVHNVVDYGPPQGLAKTLAGKGSPFIRTGAELYANRDYFGRTIVPKGMNPVAATARTVGAVARGLAPIPLSAGNFYDMLLGPDRGKYKPSEVFTTTFAGTPPRHIAPGEKGEKPKRSILDQIRTGKVYQ